jgi:hypothetical protein
MHRRTCILLAISITIAICGFLWYETVRLTPTNPNPVVYPHIIEGSQAERLRERGINTSNYGPDARWAIRFDTHDSAASVLAWYHTTLPRVGWTDSDGVSGPSSHQYISFAHPDYYMVVNVRPSTEGITSVLIEISTKRGLEAPELRVYHRSLSIT